MTVDEVYELIGQYELELGYTPACPVIRFNRGSSTHKQVAAGELAPAMLPEEIQVDGDDGRRLMAPVHRPWRRLQPGEVYIMGDWEREVMGR